MPSKTTRDSDVENEVQESQTPASESSEKGGSDGDFGEGVSEVSSSDDNAKADDAGGSDGQPRRRRRRRRRRSSGDAQGNNQNRGGNNNGRGGNRNGQQKSRRNRRNRQVSQEVLDIQGTIEGVLELHPKGYGFLRDPNKNYVSQDADAFVSSSMVEKLKLREGILIRGEVGPGSRGQGPRLKTVEAVDGRTIEDYQAMKKFDELTPINPFEQIRLEIGPKPVTMRVMDLLTPIGKGQRALLVAPPRTGKTMLLQDIAESVSTNHPEVHLIVLLIDERPEEVTEMRKLVRGEVVASSLDRDVESHVRLSQLIVERAKRVAESGRDVLILMDSITRMARAFNKWVGNSGRTATGGLDIRALDTPKKLFGTARRFEEGGSLTVVATALIDTGSRMDEAIFQEFKGTGNMELVLSRDLADRRIWPSIDITKSGTRREEKILDEETLEGATLLRRSLIQLDPVEAMEQLTRTLERIPTNQEFVKKMKQIL